MAGKRGPPRLYHNGAVHMTISGDREVFDSFQKIVLREGESCSAKIQEFMANYIKAHGSGNPIYPIDNWINNNDFRAIPALITDYDKWRNYLDNCELSELEKIGHYGNFLKIETDKRWQEKRFSSLKHKTGLEEIQESLDNEKRLP